MTLPLAAFRREIRAGGAASEMGCFSDMTPIKEQIHRLVDSLPEEREEALEEMQYRLYVLAKIERGLAELEAGKGISHEDMKLEMAQWLTDRSGRPRLAPT